MRFMFSQHPKIAKEWADKTPNIKSLPNKKSNVFRKKSTIK